MCLRVKHSINDLAGRLSTPRFLPNMLMDSRYVLRPLTFCKNLGVLKRLAKSLIECLTK